MAKRGAEGPQGSKENPWGMGSGDVVVSSSLPHNAPYVPLKVDPFAHLPWNGSVPNYGDRGTRTDKRQKGDGDPDYDPLEDVPQWDEPSDEDIDPIARDHVSTQQVIYLTGTSQADPVVRLSNEQLSQRKLAQPRSRGARRSPAPALPFALPTQSSFADPRSLEPKNSFTLSDTQALEAFTHIKIDDPPSSSSVAQNPFGNNVTTNPFGAPQQAQQSAFSSFGAPQTAQNDINMSEDSQSGFGASTPFKFASSTVAPSASAGGTSTNLFSLPQTNGSFSNTAPNKTDMTSASQPLFGGPSPFKPVTSIAAPTVPPAAGGNERPSETSLNQTGAVSTPKPLFGGPNPFKPAFPAAVSTPSLTAGANERPSESFGNNAGTASTSKSLFGGPNPFKPALSAAAPAAPSTPSANERPTETSPNKTDAASVAKPLFGGPNPFKPGFSANAPIAPSTPSANDRPSQTSLSDTGVASTSKPLFGGPNPFKPAFPAATSTPSSSQSTNERPPETSPNKTDAAPPPKPLFGASNLFKPVAPTAQSSPVQPSTNSSGSGGLFVQPYGDKNPGALCMLPQGAVASKQPGQSLFTTPTNKSTGADTPSSSQQTSQTPNQDLQQNGELDASSESDLKKLRARYDALNQTFRAYVTNETSDKPQFAAFCEYYLLNRELILTQAQDIHNKKRRVEIEPRESESAATAKRFKIDTSVSKGTPSQTTSSNNLASSQLSQTPLFKPPKSALSKSSDLASSTSTVSNKFRQAMSPTTKRTADSSQASAVDTAQPSIGKTNATFAESAKPTGPPKFAVASTNFMSAFGQQAKAAADKKRKQEEEEELDSDDDVEEFRRRKEELEKEKKAQWEKAAVKFSMQHDAKKASDDKAKSSATSPAQQPAPVAKSFFNLPPAFSAATNKSPATQQSPVPASTDFGRSIFDSQSKPMSTGSNLFSNLQKTPQADDKESDEDEETVAADEPNNVGASQPKRSLFDRVDYSSANTDSAVAEQETDAQQSGEGPSDRTCKPETPIKFGDSTRAPLFGSASTTTSASKPLFGGESTAATTTKSLFGSSSTATTTKPLFGSPAPAAATKPLFGSPAPAASKPLFAAPSTPTANLFGSPNKANPTPSLFGNFSQAAVKPANGLTTASQGLFQGHNGSNGSAKLSVPSLPQSETTSAATTRANTPSLAAEDSAAESSKETEGGQATNETNGDLNLDGAKADPQLSLALIQPAEREANEILFEAQESNIIKYDVAEKKWDAKRKATFYLLKDTTTGNVRYLARTIPVGKIAINAGVLPTGGEFTPKTRVKIAVANASGSIDTYLVQLKTKELADELVSAIQSNKPQAS